MRIVNVVMTAAFNMEIDLIRFARMTGADFRPTVFAAASLRISNPRCTLLLFKTGKCVCIGATCVHDAQYGINFCLRVLLYLHDSVHILHTAVQNIVTHDDLHDYIDIDKFAKDNAISAQYNPELFPGLRVSLSCDNNTRATVFYQGNVIITGCRTTQTVATAWQEIKARLEPYRVERHAHTSNTLTHANNAVRRQIDRIMYEDGEVST
ncbi:hypothetical protein CYMTET_37610 [Cymbomonas tetramitiformis]|uniref:TATA-box binding protein n=1 Tax=Cymbomonas tetramitiformis TaxID=36881 RepID=A0AAE0CDJ6_9CHLO|nr:hypothetical protein CYMTET_46807 [Cymbomonas tetramitiformis]KAK3244325.1 hypothetical protein CYMTET_46054 [Cymbomonas tetramitiformis]KAK3253127.1 hypothetical protein CYMTET_37610 [Cymbomonas tetramitiformis]